MSRIFVVFCVVFLTSCSSSNIKLEIVEKNISFSATLGSYGEKIQDGYKVSGTLEIRNNSTDVVRYSNINMFVIIVGKGESRTYSVLLPTPAIDASAVPIEPNSSLDQNVYWVLPPVKSLAAENIVLEWRI